MLPGPQVVPEAQAVDVKLSEPVSSPEQEGDQSGAVDPSEDASRVAPPQKLHSGRGRHRKGRGRGRQLARHAAQCASTKPAASSDEATDIPCQLAPSPTSAGAPATRASVADAEGIIKDEPLAHDSGETERASGAPGVAVASIGDSDSKGALLPAAKPSKGDKPPASLPASELSGKTTPRKLVLVTDAKPFTPLSVKGATTNAANMAADSVLPEVTEAAVQTPASPKSEQSKEDIKPEVEAVAAVSPVAAPVSSPAASREDIPTAADSFASPGQPSGGNPTATAAMTSERPPTRRAAARGRAQSKTKAAAATKAKSDSKVKPAVPEAAEAVPSSRPRRGAPKVNEGELAWSGPVHISEQFTYLMALAILT